MSDHLEFVFLFVPQEAPKQPSFQIRRFYTAFEISGWACSQQRSGRSVAWAGELGDSTGRGKGSPGGNESRGFRWQFLTCLHLVHKTPQSKVRFPLRSQRVKSDLREHGGKRYWTAATGLRLLSLNPWDPMRRFPTSKNWRSFLLPKHSFFIDFLPALINMSSNRPREAGPTASQAELHTHTRTRTRACTHTHIPEGTLARGRSASKLPFSPSKFVSSL